MLSFQLCLTLCDTMSCSPPGSSVHGILQARILEWVAMSSSRGSSQPRDPTRVSCLLHWQAGSLPLMPPGKIFEISQSVHLLSCIRLFEIPWTAAHQASLSITNSQSLLKLMSIESVMPSNHLILCHPVPFSSCLQPLLASGSFQMSQFFTSGSQSIRVSASTSVLPMIIQD